MRSARTVGVPEVRGGGALRAALEPAHLGAAGLALGRLGLRKRRLLLGELRLRRPGGNVIQLRLGGVLDEPRLIALSGTGRGGVNIDLAMKVDEIADGSHFDLSAELSGGLLNGSVGRLVAKILESDVHKSISNLATLR